MRVKYKLMPSIQDVFEYKRNNEVADKYKKLADEFVNSETLRRYGDIDAECCIGRYVVTSIKLSGETVVYDSDADKNDVLSIDEISEKFMSCGGTLLKNIYSNVVDELYCALYVTDSEQETAFRESNYADFNEVMTNWNGSDASGILTGKFVKAGVALPKSLIGRYDEMKQEVEYKTFKDSVIAEIGDDYTYFFNSEAFICKLCVEDGTPKELLAVGYSMAKLTGYLRSKGLNDINGVVGMADSTTMEVMCVRIGDTERLATKSEIKSVISGVYKKRIFCLDDYERKLLNIVAWLVSGDEKYARFAGLEKEDKVIDELLNNIQVELKAIAWMQSDKFMQEAVPEIKEFRTAVVYPDHVCDDLQLKDSIKLVDILKVVKENVDKADKWGSLAYDIANKALKDKKHAISEKQYNIVKRQYDIITQEEQKKKEKPKLSEDVLVVIREIRGKYMNNASKITKSIIDFANERGYVSEKQFNILKEELEKYRREASNAGGNTSVSKAKPLSDIPKPKFKSSVAGVTQDELDVKRAADVFGLTFSAQAISEALGRGNNGK